MTVPPALPTIGVITSRPLVFVRHGATQANLDGLRCGGDLDLPMTDQGRAQVVEAVRQMQASAWPIDLIVASDLQRTRESARMVSDMLGGVPIEINAAWRERALGQWNLRPIAENDDALRAGQQPPGGESSAAFSSRIEHALRRFLARTPVHSPLLVGSKGVGRVLGELLGTQHAAPVGNGQVLWFDLTPMLKAPTAATQRTQYGRGPVSVHACLAGFTP